MNIDIATLLLGGTQGKPKAGRVADEGFSLAMDDKLAELIQVFPGLDPQALAAALPVEGQLQETLRQTMTDLPAVDGELLAANPQITDVLAGAMSGDGESEENPLWQLQQLVMRSVSGSEVPARPDSAKPVATVSGDKPAAQSAAAPTALEATDKTPAANSAAPLSQPIPVTNDDVVAPEFASVPNAAPFPAAVHTRSSVLSKQTRDILVRLAMVQIPLLLLLAGVLLLSVRILMRNLQGVGERLAALSAGGADLTRRLPESGTQELNAIATHVNTFMNYLQGLLQQVGASTRTIAAASHQIADGNLSLSSRTEEQSASLTQTAASMEEIAGIVANNADNAEHADRLATQAAGIARRGAALMNAAVDKMGHIESSSARVADIVGVIDGIAYQTNILALNAAVEAARAGEQGRGFAVVATEVRNLALRSSSSAKEIRELINEAVSGVQDGSRLVQDAGETMNALVTSVGEVSTLMEEVKTASREQRAGIEQVNVAVCQLEGATQQNTTLVAELSSAAKAMEEQSMELESVMKRFNV